MDAQKVQDALDTLQPMVNDVLVQTGKALRASRKDGQGNVAQAHGSVQSKLPDTINTFHSALDNIEFEIMRAKSVLLRDIKELQEKKQAAQVPQPVEAQTKSPIVIDLEPSPPPDLLGQHMVETTDKKPVAPFPDMGMGLPDATEIDVSVKQEPLATSASEEPAIKSESKPSPTPHPASVSAPMAPMPPMGDIPSGDNADPNNADQSMADAELNFTDMEFSLAPTNELQNTSGPQESFDLTTFAPADGGDDLLSLMPQTSSEQSTTSAPAPASAPSISSGLPIDAAPPAAQDNSAGIAEKADEKMEDHTQDSIFDDPYVDSGQTDGLDFDFSVGEDTFDTLMADRGNYLEHGDADATFFGLDNA